MKKLKEADILKACQDLLAAEGIPCYRMQSGKIILRNGNGSRRCIKLNPEGTPDLLVHVGKVQFGGIFVNWHKIAWFEIKRPGQYPSKAQLAFKDAALERGESWHWIDDVNQMYNWVAEIKKAGRTG